MEKGLNSSSETIYYVPVLMPFNGISQLSVVILDNASIHHIQSNVQLIESTGAKVLFLLPYSPDLNPFEPVFGEVKKKMTRSFRPPPPLDVYWPWLSLWSLQKIVSTLASNVDICNLMSVYVHVP